MECLEHPGLEDVELGLVVGERAEEPRERLLAAFEEIPHPEALLPESPEKQRAHLVAGQVGHGPRAPFRPGAGPRAGAVNPRS